MPRCYVHHLPDDDSWAMQLTRDLREAGVLVEEDPEKIGLDTFIVLVGTPALKNAWESGARLPVLESDTFWDPIGRRRPVRWLPLLLRGNSATALPAEPGSGVVGDFRDSTRYAVSLFELVLKLYAIGTGHPAFRPLQVALEKQWQSTVAVLGDGVGRSGQEVFISYAWDGESQSVAEQLDQAFQARGVTILRDTREIRYRSRIKAFMRSLGRGKGVVLVISEKYLKSPSCMFELLAVAEHGNFAERIFPVVLEDARIYTPVERLHYVQYWEEQRDELETKLKKVSAADLDGIREDIDLYTKIRALLPRLMEVLRDMNTKPVDAHRASDFEELFEAIMSRLSV